jgi:hypothetical protein
MGLNIKTYWLTDHQLQCDLTWLKRIIIISLHPAYQQPVTFSSSNRRLSVYSVQLQ